MPMYRYKCVNGHVEERLESIHASVISECTVCSEKTKRIPSVPSVKVSNQRSRFISHSKRRELWNSGKVKEI
jgi:predicted nucleic acid-binding Zn ribbon protein